MRNNFIGDSMSRILTYMGNNVTKINLINDRGIHICKSMIAYQKFGEGETPESSGIKGDHLVGNYYVKYDQEINRELDEYLAGEAGLAKFEEWVQSPKGVKTLRNHKKSIDKVIGKYESEEEAIAMEKIDSPMKIFRSSFKEYFGNKLSSLGSECLEMLVQWEEDNEGVRELWRLMNSWVFDGFFTTYNDLGIEFDIIQKESEVFQEGKEIVLEALENGLLQQEDDGAIYCDLKKLNIKGVNGKKYLLRSNGTTVYMTQDIGVAYGRIINYTPDKLIYVVANEQDRHFKVLFGLLEYLNPNVVSDMTHHLSYGMVNLPSGRMKSREGTVVDADNLLKDVSISAKEITVEKWPDLSGMYCREFNIVHIFIYDVYNIMFYT
jgi:arginyl-tRNA synthetase